MEVKFDEVDAPREARSRREPTRVPGGGRSRGRRWTSEKTADGSSEKTSQNSPAVETPAGAPAERLAADSGAVSPQTAAADPAEIGLTDAERQARAVSRRRMEAELDVEPEDNFGAGLFS